LHGPRSIDIGPDGTMYLILREGNKVYSIDPVRIIGLEDMMGDAVKFKYVPAPLTGEQLATLVQVPK